MKMQQSCQCLHGGLRAFSGQFPPCKNVEIAKSGKNYNEHGFMLLMRGK
jgi:hypothetical protein